MPALWVTHWTAFVSFHAVANLSQPGTFAGNDAIVAFARSQQVKVVIHQLNTLMWEVGAEASKLHHVILWADIFI